VAKLLPFSNMNQQRREPATQQKVLELRVHRTGQTNVARMSWCSACCLTLGLFAVVGLQDEKHVNHNDDKCMTAFAVLCVKTGDLLFHVMGLASTASVANSGHNMNPTFTLAELLALRLLLGLASPLSQTSAIIME
jgi:hypothetical protein